MLLIGILTTLFIIVRHHCNLSNSIESFQVSRNVAFLERVFNNNKIIYSWTPFFTERLTAEFIVKLILMYILQNHCIQWLL